MPPACSCITDSSSSRWILWTMSIRRVDWITHAAARARKKARRAFIRRAMACARISPTRWLSCHPVYRIRAE